MKYLVYNVETGTVIKAPLGNGLTSDFSEGQVFTEKQADLFIDGEELLMKMTANIEYENEEETDILDLINEVAEDFKEALIGKRIVFPELKNPTEKEMQKLMNALNNSPAMPIIEGSDKIVFDSHPLCDTWDVQEHVKPIYDCDEPSINTPYDPDGTGKPKKNNVKLIKKVLKKTAAVDAGGVKMQVEEDRVILYSNGKLDFTATGIFDSLGIFDVKITCDRKHRVLLVIS